MLEVQPGDIGYVLWQEINGFGVADISSAFYLDGTNVSLCWLALFCQRGGSTSPTDPKDWHGFPFLVENGRAAGNALVLRNWE